MITMISDREQAAFEAGIKLGALYHQWVGTPITRETAGSVEKAIEDSVSLQPHVTAITVRLNRDMMTENRFGYSELAGSMYDVRITTRVGDVSCQAELKHENDYPMMRLTDIDEKR